MKEIVSLIQFILHIKLISKLISYSFLAMQTIKTLHSTWSLTTLQNVNAASSSNPEIHVHIPERLITPKNHAPLSNHQSPPLSKLSQVIDLTATSSDKDKDIYPPTLDFFLELHHLQPLCNYPQYYDKLAQHGILYVDSILKLNATFFSDIIRIPVAAVDTFLAHAKNVIKKAKKGKSPIKQEDIGEDACEMWLIPPHVRVDKNKENFKDWVF